MIVEELLKALGLDETKNELVKNFAAEKDAEITKKINEIKTLKDNAKKDKEELAAIKQFKEKVIDALDLDDDVEDIEAAIEKYQETLKNNSGKDNNNANAAELEKQKKECKRLERELARVTQASADLEKNSLQWKAKYHDARKTDALEKAIIERKLAHPELMINTLINDVGVTDEGEIFYKTKEGEEITIKEAVEKLAAKYPDCILNDQNAGAGSGGGGASNTETSFAKQILDSRQQSGAMQKAEAAYFGGGNS